MKAVLPRQQPSRAQPASYSIELQSLGAQVRGLLRREETHNLWGYRGLVVGFETGRRKQEIAFERLRRLQAVSQVPRGHEPVASALEKPKSNTRLVLLLASFLIGLAVAMTTLPALHLVDTVNWSGLSYQVKSQLEQGLTSTAQLLKR